MGFKKDIRDAAKGSIHGSIAAALGGVVVYFIFKWMK